MWCVNACALVCDACVKYLHYMYTVFAVYTVCAVHAVCKPCHSVMLCVRCMYATYTVLYSEHIHKRGVCTVYIVCCVCLSHGTVHTTCCV